MALIGLFACVTGRDVARSDPRLPRVRERDLRASALLATYGLPGLVEAGVFLDVLVIVLVMEGVVMQIRREHESIDVDRAAGAARLMLLVAAPGGPARRRRAARARAAARAGHVVHGARHPGHRRRRLAVAVAVVPGSDVTALDGFLRADALSAWMVALIGMVAALAAVEAPRYVTTAPTPRFYPLFHLFVFTMLLAVTTDDLGFMWVAVEGTTLASVFLVNFERTRASLEAVVQVPADLLGGHRGGLPGHRPGVLRRRPALRRRRARAAVDDAAAAGARPAARGRRAGLRVPRSSATAPRRGSRRCTRGCPTPTARRRRR